MNKLSFLLLYRDARSGELRLLVLALVLAVAAMTAVGFFSDRVRQALVVEANQLLGADLVLASDHDLAPEFEAQAREIGLQSAHTVSFPSMVMAGTGFRLADVKAVDALYPLRGQLRISSSPEGAGDAVRGAPEPGSVWIEPRLGAELGVGPGALLQLGKLPLRVAAYLNFEPDRGVNFLGVAPRLMLNLADLEATGLVQNGARVRYRLLVAGESRAVEKFSQWLLPRLGRGEKLEEGTRQEVRSALERARRFLGLASLLTVMLAATAMAIAVNRHIQRHLDGCALLRCLGASGGEVLRLYCSQFLILGLAATLVGVALGFVTHYAFYQLLAGLFPSALPAPGGMPALQGLVLGLLLLLGFALPPLLRLYRISPLRVIRRDLGLPPPSLLAAYGLGLLVFAGLIFWMADDPRLGGSVVVAFGLALVLFLFVARGLVWGIAWLRHQNIDQPFGWRYGLASLERHAWASSLQILALALGFMALLLLTVIRSELLAAWERSVPADAPNRFIINIQPEQRQRLLEQMRPTGWKLELAPMVRGRLTKIGERAVSPADYPEDERAQSLVEREFNLSWRADLPPGNRLEAGRWFAATATGPAAAEASVEAGLARTLGIELGDELTFSIAGQPVTARVTSLRKLDWDSMRINFFVLMSPGVIDAMPASYLGNFYLPPGEAPKLGPVLQNFPNLTVIDVEAVLAQLKSVIGQTSSVVQLVFLFTLGAGLLVLHGAMISVFDERRLSLSIMRALGASRSQLRAALQGELAAIGALAGLLAAVGALLAGQVLAWRLFDLALTPAWWVLPLSVFAGVLLTVGIGRFSLAKLLSARPLEIIRSA
ncbi:MAG: FtsX-like permease family protein [Azovibrio sp.]|uniref:ABC transporter permease n=1 Tax=Azovibrio sp. TaxID=1872673 RepID=UPI003C784C27